MIKIKGIKETKKRQPTFWLILIALICGFFFYAFKQNWFGWKDKVLQTIGIETSKDE